MKKCEGKTTLFVCTKCNIRTRSRCTRPIENFFAYKYRNYVEFFIYTCVFALLTSSCFLLLVYLFYVYETFFEIAKPSLSPQRKSGTAAVNGCPCLFWGTLCCFFLLFYVHVGRYFFRRRSIYN